MIAVADTGFVVAILDRRDRYHQRTVQIYRQTEQIYLPQTTLAEITYLIHRQRNQLAVAEFLEKLPASRLTMTPLIEQDLQATTRILRDYADSRIDFVDATVMAVAERLGITTILTLDHRDFRIYRPVHCRYFTLLPEL